MKPLRSAPVQSKPRCSRCKRSWTRWQSSARPGLDRVLAIPANERHAAAAAVAQRTDVLSRLGRAVQLAFTVLACLVLAVELLVAEPLDGIVLPGLPDPPGELITLSHGKTHYRLQVPRASSTSRRSSVNDPTTSAVGSVQLPVVVCIHGVATYSYVWDPLLERLRSEGAFVLTYDLWGHGHSDGPDAVYDTALYTSQLAQLLAGLGLFSGSGDGSDTAASLVLVGVQYGAVIARQFAVLHPHLVAGLMLLESNTVAALAGDTTNDPNSTGVGWQALVQRGKKLVTVEPNFVTFADKRNQHRRIFA